MADNENRKLYWVVAIFVFLGAVLVSVGYTGDRVQIGIRGFISGEAEWMKAQKNSTISLLQYIRIGDAAHYKDFNKSLQVIYGTRMAREALLSDEPNRDKARKGFLMGNNHPDEIDEMIWVFEIFNDLDQVQKALKIWELGDRSIDQLAALAEQIHSHRSIVNLDDNAIDDLYNELSTIEVRLSSLEEEFTVAMSNFGRWAGNLVYWLTIIKSVLLIGIAAITVILFMRNYREANDRLKDSEQKIKNVLDQSRDVIYQIKIGSHKYDYMSRSVRDMMGYIADDIMEGGPAFILERTHPDDIESMKEKIEQLESDEVEKQLTQDSEFRIKRSDGTYIWVNNKRSLLKDSEGDPYAIVGNVRDITLHKQQIEILDKSIVEKQTLLAEIHHRVKNNLAIVSSLIELQKDEVTPDVQQSFQVVQSRIKSIALIHEKLYQSTIFSEVELSDYIQELTDMISETYQSTQKDIDSTFDLEDVKVDMTTAVPVGLICNELINNSFKHAFKNIQKGEILIRLRKRFDHIILEVADDGIGLPPGFELSSANGLGMTLLNVLTQQLGGEISVQPGRNTSFKLRFPVSVHEKAELHPA